MTGFINQLNKIYEIVQPNKMLDSTNKFGRTKYEAEKLKLRATTNTSIQSQKTISSFQLLHLDQKKPYIKAFLNYRTFSPLFNFFS